MNVPPIIPEPEHGSVMMRMVMGDVPDGQLQLPVNGLETTHGGIAPHPPAASFCAYVPPKSLGFECDGAMHTYATAAESADSTIKFGVARYGPLGDGQLHVPRSHPGGPLS